MKSITVRWIPKICLVRLMLILLSLSLKRMPSLGATGISLRRRGRGSRSQKKPLDEVKRWECGGVWGGDACMPYTWPA